MDIQPAVSYIMEPFRFMFQYTASQGNSTGFGFLRDRDQVTFAVSYLLNEMGWARLKSIILAAHILQEGQVNHKADKEPPIEPRELSRMPL